MKWTTLTIFLTSNASLLFGAESTPAGMSPEPKTIAPAPAPERSRSTSPETSAKLNSGLPKFSPSAAAKARAEEASPDLRETDAPRNAIIRLPQFDVREDQPPQFKERELLTPEGRVELALKRHPGLKFGPLAFLNVRRGLEMLEEENSLERRREIADLLSFAAAVEEQLPRNPETGARTVSTKAAE